MDGNFNADAIGVGVMIALLIVYLAVVILVIVQYVLYALGLYDTARKRQIPHAWLAWVPLIGNWVLGAVVDYHSARRGQPRRWRTVMLWICIIIAASYVLMMVAMLSGAVVMGTMEHVETGAGFGYMLVILPLYLLLIGACVTYTFCHAVCLYKVYEEILPEKAVKYLLLSCLVPLAIGICMRRCAKVPVEPVQAAEPATPALQPGEGFVPQDPFAKEDQN